MIHKLVNYALENGIEVILTDKLSPKAPSVADVKSKSIVINLNFKNEQMLPFIIAHEISHILTCDSNDAELCFSTLLNTRYEYKANKGAVKLLIPYYLSELDSINEVNVYSFMDMFQIPNNMYDLCCKNLSIIAKNNVCN